MLYNSPGRSCWFAGYLKSNLNAGSKIYLAAKSLSEYWEGQWQAVVGDDLHRPPTTEEAGLFIEMCHRISSEQLGSVLKMIDSSCALCMSKV